MAAFAFGFIHGLGFASALAFLLRGTRFYRIAVMRAGSWIIIAIATVWLYQRVFDVAIPALEFLTPS